MLVVKHVVAGRCAGDRYVMLGGIFIFCTAKRSSSGAYTLKWCDGLRAFLLCGKLIAISL